MCARIATPSWRTSKWNGDGVLLAKALEAGAQLLAAEGATVGFHADLIWPDGKETVDSADAARAALKRRLRAIRLSPDKRSLGVNLGP
ncbi:MAG: hypothetical protein AABM29_11525 [Actinomycetota bacterium]